MVTRIRYIEKDNKLVSKNNIISQRTGAVYRVEIDLESMTYLIRNTLTFRKYEGGENITNMNVLKRTVKKRLESLGCVFGKEVRNRTFGLVEKGMTQEKHMRKVMEERRKQASTNNGEAN